MAITTPNVTAIALSYANTAAWSVFDASNRASAGNLQANWDALVDDVSALYKPLLNSAVDEIGVLEGVSGAEKIGISGITGISTGATVYSAIYSLNTALSAFSVTASVTYAGSAGTASYASVAGSLSSYGNIMTTTASQVMTNYLAAANLSSYSASYTRNIILSTTAATGGASGDVWFMYTA